MSAEAEVFAVRMTVGAKADYKSAGREPTDYVSPNLRADTWSKGIKPRCPPGTHQGTHR